MILSVSDRRKKYETLKEKRLQAAWREAENAVELIDWAHVRRYGIDGLGPLRRKEELIEDVVAAVMARVDRVDRVIVHEMATALVESEWAKALEV